SVLQIPASRTRTSAHPGRSFGSGLDVAFNFPLSTRKESTVRCLACLLLVFVGARFCRQSPPSRRRHFLDQIELGLKPHQTAIEKMAAPGRRALPAKSRSHKDQKQ